MFSCWEKAAHGCAGTRGPLDMIEIPSHFFEHFFRSEECVKLCSSHHLTGEALPDKVREAFRRHWDFMPALKMNDSVRSAQQLLAYTSVQPFFQTLPEKPGLLQIVNAMIDQRFHDKQQQGASNQSLEIAHVVEQYSVLAPPADPSIHHHLRLIMVTLLRIAVSSCHALIDKFDCRFGHLVTYGASYYSYVYAKYIADAIWQQQFEEDPFSRQAGKRCRLDIV